MKKSSLLLALVCLACRPGLGQSRYSSEIVASQFLSNPRKVSIYLPASYAREINRRYAVLYVHDGQNAFSTAGTNVAFGWGNWELDKTTDKLSENGKVRELILVAIDNSPLRLHEYSGEHHIERASTNTPYENYAAFLIKELKPKIDKEYRTLPGPATTGAMGSSMGGLCSLALAWDHPEIFGKAASLSGAFQVEHTNFLNQVLRAYQGKVKSIRLYLDSGTVDFMGGDDGRSLTEAVADELRRIGWHDDLMHYVDAKPLLAEKLAATGLRQDKWREAQTSQHNEFYWRLRVWRPLTFLFPPGDK